MKTSNYSRFPLLWFINFENGLSFQRVEFLRSTKFIFFYHSEVLYFIRKSIHKTTKRFEKLPQIGFELEKQRFWTCSTLVWCVLFSGCVNYSTQSRNHNLHNQRTIHTKHACYSSKTLFFESNPNLRRVFELFCVFLTPSTHSRSSYVSGKNNS